MPWGDKYGPIVVMKDEPLNMNKANWTMIVSNKELISDYETIAEVRYLSEDAPDNLDANVEFELYEGIKLVARGVIL
ncbi:MAG: hypothetical protein GX802_05330 [Clostridiales bacterium]|nr:hypothetical protein [Clostridiales bacterium]